MQLNLWSIPCSYHPTTTKLIAMISFYVYQLNHTQQGCSWFTSLTPKGAIRLNGRAYKPEHPESHVGG